MKLSNLILSTLLTFLLACILSPLSTSYALLFGKPPRDYGQLLPAEKPPPKNVGTVASTTGANKKRKRPTNNRSSSSNNKKHKKNKVKPKEDETLAGVVGQDEMVIAPE